MNNQGFKGVGKINLSISRLILTFMMLLIVVVGGTFAWFTFSSRKSALVLTIGSINNAQITLSPYQVKQDNMAPVSSYTGGVHSDVSINNGVGANTITLYYKVNELDSAFVENGLMFKVVNVTTGVTEVTAGFTYNEGDSGIATGEKVLIKNGEAVIFEKNVINATAADYKVYLWVETLEKDQNAIVGKTLNVELNGAIGSAKIRGTNTFGEALVADVTDFKNNIVGDSVTVPADYSYQWYSSDYNDMYYDRGTDKLISAADSTKEAVIIDGADERNYTIGPGLIGKYIYVVVKVNRGGTQIIYTDVTDNRDSDSDGDYNNVTDRVEKRPVNSLVATSRTWVYDGADHYTYTLNDKNEPWDDGCTINNLISGDDVSCKMNVVKYTKSIVRDATGTGTNDGVPNEIAGYKIMRGSIDVTNDYEVPTYQHGKLQVDRASCVCTLSADPDDELVLYNTFAKNQYEIATFPMLMSSNESSSLKSMYGLLELSCYDSRDSSETEENKRRPDGNRYIISSAPSVITISDTLGHYNYPKDFVLQSENFPYSPDSDYGFDKNDTSAKGGDADPGVWKSYANNVGYSIGEATITGGSEQGTNYKKCEVSVGLSARTYSYTIQYHDLVFDEYGHATSYELTDYNSVHNFGDTSANNKLLSASSMGIPNSDFVPYGFEFAGWSLYADPQSVDANNDPIITIDLNDEANVAYLEDIYYGTISDGDVIDLYAVYKRTYKFYSGIENVDTTTREATLDDTIIQYVHGEDLTVVTMPTPIVASIGNGWTVKGYGWDLTADNNYDAAGFRPQPDYSYCNLDTSNNTCARYALYTRDISFVSTTDGVSCSGDGYYPTQYYNSYGSISSVESLTPSDININSYWETVGYKSGFTAYTSGDTIYPSNTSITPAVSDDNSFVAVYKNEQVINFYSGLDEATNNSETVETYYVSCVGTLPTTVQVWAPFTPDGTVDKNTAAGITGWTPLGFRDDKTTGVKEYEFLDDADEKITVSIGAAKNFYAVYQRTITFYSGLNSATTDGTRTQYYNSANTDSAKTGENVSSITSYTPASLSSSLGWSSLGYRGDTTAGASVYSKGSSTVTPSILATDLIHSDSTLNNKLWAVYKRTVSFYTSSVSGDTIQTVSLNTTPSTREQYYNSYGTVGTVKSYEPTELTGWTALGWRNDTTADVKEYDKGTTTDISPAVNGSNKLYSVYSKGVTAYSGIDGAFVTHTGTLYYNSYDVASTLILPSESSAGSFNKKMTAVSNWTFTGWSSGSLNENTNNWELSREPNSLLFNSSLPIRVYAQYSRTIEFKSGLDEKKSHTSATQTYQSKGDVSEIDLPTSSNTGSITNWTKVGWRYDTTPGAAFCRYVVLNSTTCSPPVTSGNILYAVYSRSVTFKSGSNGSTTHSPARIQYYNSANVDGVSNNGDNVSAIDVFTATPISNWEHLGWSSSSSATVAEYPTTSTTTSISPYATTGITMYAVYSRGQNVMFYSGLDGSKELEVKGEVIYASGSSTPTHITLNVPTAEETSDITNWREIGYRSDATATSQQKSFGGTITVEFGGSYSYYAVYERYLEFVSGVDEGTVHTSKRVQYYNSANTDSAKTGENVSGVTTFTAMGISSYDENDNTSGWDFIGWRDDVTPDNYEYTGSTIYPLANTAFTTYSVDSSTKVVTCRLYAVYERTMLFMTGLNTEEYGATEKDARTQYYNSFDVDSEEYGENVSFIYSHNSEALVCASWNSDCDDDDVDGWNPIGYSDDIDADSDSPLYEIGEDKKIYPYADVFNVLYTVYENSATIDFYSGIDQSKKISKTEYVYYSSGISEVDIPLDVYISVPTSGDNYTASIGSADSGWSKEGYTSDETLLSTADIDLFELFGEEINVSVGVNALHEYYAIYKRQFTVKYGLDEARTHYPANAIQYYNSYDKNGSNSGSSPKLDGDNISDIGNTTSIDIGYKWDHIGWRDDTTPDVPEYPDYDNFSPSITSKNTLYAVYDRDFTFISGLDEATTNGVRQQYYNSANTDSTKTGENVSSVSIYTPATITGWNVTGWSDSKDASVHSFYTGATITLPYYSTTDDDTFKFYAVYNRSLTFKSGINGATTHSPTRTQYYNSYDEDSSLIGENVDQVSTFTPTKINDCWIHIGWSDDSTTLSAEYPVSNVGPYATSGNILYAVYERTIVFKSGINGATTHSPERKQYYNSGGAATQVSPIVTFTPNSITGWTTLGWRGDTSASAQEYQSATSINPNANKNLNCDSSTKKCTIYAVYSKTGTAVFYHGVNKAMHTDVTWTTYYNSNTASLPTSVTVTSPTKAQNTDITGWKELGYRDENDTSAAAATIGFADGEATVTIGGDDNFYAVYSNTYTVNFWHGINKAGNAGDPTFKNKTVYYNTATASVPTTVEITTPVKTVLTDIGNGWDALGYATNATSFTASIGFGVKVYPSIGATTDYYAVYKRAVTFKSGYKGAITTHSPTRDQYYNSGGAASNVSSVDTFTAASLPCTTWVHDGWQDSNDVAYYEAVSSISPPANAGNTINAYYEAQPEVWFYHGTNGVSTSTYIPVKSTLVSYTTNSTTDPASTTTVKTPTSSSISGVGTGWSKSGFSTSSSSNTVSVGFNVNTSISICGTNKFYAVYSNTYTVNFWHGINKAGNAGDPTFKNKSVYYNTATASVPTTVEITAPAKTALTDIGNGWDASGYATNATSFTASIGFGVKVSPSIGTTTDYYAVYKRAVTFKSGYKGAITTHSPTRDQYYNSGGAASNVSSVDTFTAASLPCTTWVHDGWQDSNDVAYYGAVSSISPPANAGNTILAYYEAQPVVWFYHGEDGVSTSTYIPVESTLVSYTTSTTTDPASETTVKTPTSSSISGVGTGWSKSGFSTSSSSNTVSVGFNVNTSISICGTNKFYAVYSNTYTVNFWHGINKAGNAGDPTFKNKSVYYNTATASVPTTVEITTPAKTALTDIGNGWDAQGYATSATSFTASIGFGVKVYPSIGTTTDYYAVYKRAVTFKSGKKGAIETHSPTRDQYYNSGGAASNVSSVDTFTAKSLGGSWEHVGWQDSEDVAYYEAVSSISPPANAGNTILAYYEAQPDVRFYHGISGYSDAECSSTSTCISVKSTLVSYTTNASVDPASTTTVVTPAKTSITDIGNGWNRSGFRTDDSSSAPTVGFNVGTSIALSNTLFEFFAIYDVTETAKLYHGENGDSDTTCTDDLDSKCRLLSATTVYYNSRNTTPTSVANIQMPEYSSLISIDEMYPTGYRWDTQNISPQWVQDNIVPVEIGSDTKFYTIYYASSGLIIWDGVNNAWDHGIIGEVYYNSSTDTAPTTIDINVPTASETEDITSWNKGGYWCDANNINNDFGAAVPVPINNQSRCYAYYTRNIETWFYVGLNPNGPQVHYFQTEYRSSEYSDAVLPTTAQINLLAEEEVAGGSIDNWKMIGWRDDSSAGNKEYGFGGVATARIDIINAYYATYERKLDFVSGENGEWSSIIETQYYNSGGSATNVSSVSLPNVAAEVYPFTNWGTYGWSLNTLPTTPTYTTTSGSISPAADATFDTCNVDSSSKTVNCEIYHVYKRTLTFKSGSSCVTDGTRTQYYNSGGASYNVSAVTTPTTSTVESIAGWYKNSNSGYAGYHIDADAEIPNYGITGNPGSSTTISPDLHSVSDNTLRFIYYKNITFYSQGDGVMVADGTRTQYYNSCSGDLSEIYSYEPETEYLDDGWTALGYSPDTSSTTASYAKGTSTKIKPGHDVGWSLYAVYEYSQKVSVYGYKPDSSGQLSGDESTVKVYHNAYSITPPNTTEFTLPNGSTAGSLGNGWVLRGLRDDDQAGTPMYDYDEKIDISLGATNKFYAVWDRTVTAYNGRNKEFSATATQYYNSSGNASFLETPTNAYMGYFNDKVYLPTDGSWDYYGWSKEDDSFDSITLSSSGVTLGVDEAPTLYAIYDRTVYFRSGWAFQEYDGERSQYYNTGGSLSYVDNVPTPSNMPSRIAGNWEKLGYTVSLSEAYYPEFDTEETGADSIQVPFDFNPSLFAVYRSYPEFISGKNVTADFSYVQYYNSYGVFSTIDPDRYSIDGFSFLGWRDDEDADVSEYSSFEGGPGASYNYAGKTYYAVYYDYLYIYSGVTSDTDPVANPRRYYNSAGYYWTPFNGDYAVTVPGWTFAGWSTLKDAPNLINVATASASGASVGNVNSIYAIYKRSVYFNFGFYSEVFDIYNDDYYTETQYRSWDGSYYVNVPDASEDFDVMNYWSHIGWRDDGTATSAEDVSESSSLNFYAVYSRTKRVYYNANGGSGAPSSPSTKVIYINSSGLYDRYAYALSSTEITLSGTRPTRTNYTFAGWATSSTATVGTWSAGAYYKPFGFGSGIDTNWDETLYAVWTPVAS